VKTPRRYHCNLIAVDHCIIPVEVVALLKDGPTTPLHLGQHDTLSLLDTNRGRLATAAGLVMARTTGRLRVETRREELGRWWRIQRWRLRGSGPAIGRALFFAGLGLLVVAALTLLAACQ
jgi:hypothetical protein